MVDSSFKHSYPLPAYTKLVNVPSTPQETQLGDLIIAKNPKRQL